MRNRGNPLTYVFRFSSAFVPKFACFYPDFPAFSFESVLYPSNSNISDWLQATLKLHLEKLPPAGHQVHLWIPRISYLEH